MIKVWHWIQSNMHFSVLYVYVVHEWFIKSTRPHMYLTLWPLQIKKCYSITLVDGCHTWLKMNTMLSVIKFPQICWLSVLRWPVAESAGRPCCLPWPLSSHHFSPRQFTHKSESQEQRLGPQTVQQKPGLAWKCHTHTQSVTKQYCTIDFPWFCSDSLDWLNLIRHLRLGMGIGTDLILFGFTQILFDIHCQELGLGFSPDFQFNSDSVVSNLILCQKLVLDIWLKKLFNF